jgi:hypothetical protein
VTRSYDAKTEALFDAGARVIATMDANDCARAAMALLDQAGLTLREQERVAKLLVERGMEVTP